MITKLGRVSSTLFRSGQKNSSEQPPLTRDNNQSMETSGVFDVRLPNPDELLSLFKESPDVHPSIIAFALGTDKPMVHVEKLERVFCMICPLNHMSIENEISFSSSNALPLIGCNKAMFMIHNMIQEHEVTYGTQVEIVETLRGISPAYLVPMNTHNTNNYIFQK